MGLKLAKFTIYFFLWMETNSFHGTQMNSFWASETIPPSLHPPTALSHCDFCVSLNTEKVWVRSPECLTWHLLHVPRLALISCQFPQRARIIRMGCTCTLNFNDVLKHFPHFHSRWSPIIPVARFACDPVIHWWVHIKRSSGMWLVKLTLTHGSQNLKPRTLNIHPLRAPVRHWEEHSSVVGTKMETSYHANYLAKEWRQQGLLMFKELTMSMTVCLGTSNVISLHDEIKI